MNAFARAFDEPIESEAHQLLASTAWMGGPSVSIRYYLGRFVDRNLFRATDDEVARTWRAWAKKWWSTAAESLLNDEQGWILVADLLRHRFEAANHAEASQNHREMAAIDAILANPQASDAEVAAVVGVSGIALARMPTFKLTRILLNRAPPAK